MFDWKDESNEEEEEEIGKTSTESELKSKIEKEAEKLDDDQIADYEIPKFEESKVVGKFGYELDASNA